MINKNILYGLILYSFVLPISILLEIYSSLYLLQSIKVNSCIMLLFGIISIIDLINTKL